MTDKLKKVYVSGPYSASTPWETEINIMAARIIAAELFRRGYSVFCPHSNSSHMDGVVDYDHFIQADLEWVDICDELYVFGDWKQSPGSYKEVQRAVSKFIPVYNIEFKFSSKYCSIEFTVENIFISCIKYINMKESEKND